MIDAHHYNVLAHVSAGGLALFVGAVPLFTRKGGPLHRWSGRTAAALGFVVLASATIADLVFSPSAPLVAATLTAGYQYLSGLRTLSLGRRGPVAADAVLALCGLGAAMLIAFDMGQGTGSWTPQIGYSTIGFLAVVTLYDLSRHLWIAGWLRHVRPLDHGVKMIGFYFAMMSAGAGNLLAEFQPLSQLAPSALGVATMVGFVVWYTRHPLTGTRGHPLRAA